MVAQGGTSIQILASENYGNNEKFLARETQALVDISPTWNRKKREQKWSHSSMTDILYKGN